MNQPLKQAEITRLKQLRSEADFDPTFRNAQKAFRNAIDNKVLSLDPDNDNYAGNYMYMHTHAGKDAFKSINYRNYIYSTVNN